MKIKQLLIATFMLLAFSQAIVPAQVRPRVRPGVDPNPPGPRPDLMIKSVTVLDNFRVTVLIENDGEGKLLHKIVDSKKNQEAGTA